MGDWSDPVRVEEVAPGRNRVDEKLAAEWGKDPNIKNGGKKFKEHNVA